MMVRRTIFDLVLSRRLLAVVEDAMLTVLVRRALPALASKWESRDFSWVNLLVAAVAAVVPHHYSFCCPFCVVAYHCVASLLWLLVINLL